MNVHKQVVVSCPRSAWVTFVILFLLHGFASHLNEVFQTANGRQLTPKFHGSGLKTTFSTGDNRGNGGGVGCAAGKAVSQPMIGTSNVCHRAKFVQGMLWQLE
jgi:hypothetical protein